MKNSGQLNADTVNLLQRMVPLASVPDGAPFVFPRTMKTCVFYTSNGVRYLTGESTENVMTEEADNYLQTEAQREQLVYLLNSKEEQEVVTLLNRIFALCGPIHYEEFNVLLPAGENLSDLRELEEQDSRIVLAAYGTPEEGVSTLSLVATITQILAGNRLGFTVDNNSMITGVAWYNER